MAKITIIDYGINNIKSILAAVRLYEDSVLVSSKIEDILTSEKLILPGVGAFHTGMQKLETLGILESIKIHAQTKPILGICLGMQLLFSRSFEFGVVNGIGLIDGEVINITTDNSIPIPFIGWSPLNLDSSTKLCKNIISEKDRVYFIHSFKCMPKNKNIIKACTRYHDIAICAVVEQDNIFGTQFHPEKSGDIGLKIIKNFVNI